MIQLQLKTLPEFLRNNLEKLLIDVFKDEATQFFYFKEVAGETGYINTGANIYLTITTKARNCVKRIQKMLDVETEKRSLFL